MGRADHLAAAAGRLEEAAARLEGVLATESGWRADALAEAVQGYLSALDALTEALEAVPAEEAVHLSPALSQRLQALLTRHERIHARLLHDQQEIAELLPRLRQQRTTLDAYAGPPASGGGFLDHQG